MSLVTETVSRTTGLTSSTSMGQAEQSSSNPITPLATETLANSGQNFQTIVEQANFSNLDNLLNCSQLFASSTNPAGLSQTEQQIRAFENAQSQCKKIIAQAKNAINDPKSNLAKIDRNLNMLAFNSTRLHNLRLDGKALEEKLAYVARLFTSRDKKLNDLQGKIESSVFEKKEELRRKLLMQQTLLKVVKEQHLKHANDVSTYCHQDANVLEAQAKTYQTILDRHAGNSLSNLHLEVRSYNAEKRLAIIPEGKNHAKRIQEAKHSLTKNFKHKEENVTTGLGGYEYINIDKETVFKEKVRAAQENFVTFSREAIQFKQKIIKELSELKHPSRDTQFAKKLAFNNETQMVTNIANFDKANEGNSLIKNDTIKAAVAMWKEICNHQSRMYTRVLQGEKAIESLNNWTNYTGQMYYTSKVVINNLHAKSIYQLDPDLNAKENFPESYPFLEITSALEVKKEEQTNADANTTAEVAQGAEEEQAKHADASATAEVKPEVTQGAEAGVTKASADVQPEVVAEFESAEAEAKTEANSEIIEITPLEMAITEAKAEVVNKSDTEGVNAAAIASQLNTEMKVEVEQAEQTNVNAELISSKA